MSVRVDLLETADVVREVGPRAGGSAVLVCCAGLDGNARLKREQSATMLDENVRITSSILRLALHWHIPDVVVVSSAEVYSGSCSGLITEDSAYSGWSEPSANGYVLSKVYSELLALSRGAQHGIRVYCPRPTNLYGPGDDAPGEFQRVIPSMIGQARTGQDIELWGDGTQRRSFMFVEDMVRGVLAVVRHHLAGPVNIGVHDDISIADLANLILLVFGGTGRVRVRTSAPTGTRGRSLDLRKLESVIDFKPRSLNQGLYHMRDALSGRLDG